MVLHLTSIGILNGACQGSLSPSSAEVSGDSRAPQNSDQRYEYEFPSMGTLVHISAYGPNDEAVEVAFQATKNRVSELAQILTDYDPSSETRQLSSRAAQAPTKVSDPLWQVLQSADVWNEKSDGAFDSSLGSLNLLWRKFRRAGKVPTSQDVRAAQELTGWKSIQLNAQDQTVVIADQRIRLDFGAIGKGYIADQAYLTLAAHGLKRSLVNISGNMRCGLPPPGKAGWRISIAPIEQNGESIQQIELVNQAIATSGDLWQFTTVDGIRRSHIIDPHTGYGVVGPLAVTVLAPTAIDADALATIGCVLDWQKFSKLIAAHEGAAALRASRSDGQKSVVIERTDLFPQSN